MHNTVQRGIEQGERGREEVMMLGRQRVAVEAGRAEGGLI